MIDQHDNGAGPQLPSTILHYAYQVVVLAYAMARTWYEGSRLVRHLKRKFKGNTK